MCAFFLNLICELALWKKGGKRKNLKIHESCSPTFIPLPSSFDFLRFAARFAASRICFRVRTYWVYLSVEFTFTCSIRVCQFNLSPHHHLSGPGPRVCVRERGDEVPKKKAWVVVEGGGRGRERGIRM
jgi:hypothetical protein